MRASLIIATYDNARFLKVVLDSLHYQTDKEFEIIVAEDGENEAVGKLVEQYPFEQPWLHLTQRDEGWQKNKAMNQAVRAARTDWLVFIDGDCVLHPRFVEMHLRYADERSILAGKRVKLDAASSQFLLENVSNIHLMQRRLVRKLLVGHGGAEFLEEGIFLSPDAWLGFIPKARRAHHLKGCNMSFSKKAIYAINGFDEDYQSPAVGEDHDLSWRFEAAGYRHKSVRNLAVQYHLYHPESWASQEHNVKLCREKQRRNEYVCGNGLTREAPHG